MPLRTTRARSTGTTLAALLLMPLTLTSCGGDQQEKADPTSTTSQAAPSSSTSKASPVSRPSPSSSAAGKGLMDPSPQGAVYLTRHYYRLVNEAGREPKKDQVPTVTMASCKSCTGLEASFQRLRDRGEHYTKDTVQLGSITTVFESGGFTEVHFDLHQNDTPVVSKTGEHVRTVPAGDVKSVIFAKWTSRGWRVHEIQNIQN